ncbi:MAG: pyrroline-5-carboxylate reductase [Deinococcales bacterium]
MGVKALSLEEVSAEHLLLAVKPQVFPQVASRLAGKAQSYISLMAGITLAQMAQSLQTKRIVRVMPNLGASLGLSATALCHLEAEAQDIDFATELFKAVGTVYPLEEKLLDAFTGLAGSGPAFVAVFAEALADGAVKVGFSRDIARDVARQVILASASLLAEKSPSQLKDEVCSPGGTSIAGVSALEEHGLRHAVMSAVEAASKRAKELSG